MSGGLSGCKKALLTGSGIALALALGMGSAEARGHRHAHRHSVRPTRHLHRISAGRAGGYRPPLSEIVVDANSGRTLFSRDENELRHPASLTKVMTLYLLFEQLQKGRMALDTEIGVSPHAASMAPTKLGLRPGSHITVDNAVRAIVTKSANDMAVAVAEAIGGSEDHFAELMTAKAHELGMSRTQYVNASGLPNDGQLTTAHDLAVLGRAVQDRFPQYFHYFATPSFRYAGSFMANHDHLLGHVDGVDGIKTGFTNASGYNLLTDVRRGGRHLVAVVLGGTSWRSRDLMMTGLIADHIAEASVGRNAAPIAEAAADPAPAVEHVREETAVAAADSEVERPAVRRERPEAPTRAMPLSYASYEKPRPAFVASSPKAAADETPVTDSIPKHALDGSTRAQGSSATPAPLRWVVGAQPVRTHDHVETSARPSVAVKVAVARTGAEDATDESEPAAPHRAGVQIQIGATDDIDQAKDLLMRAKGEGRMSLARAQPFTEKVKKAGATLWRARFAGLDASQAEAACKTLKRSGFSCFTIKD